MRVLFGVLLTIGIAIAAGFVGYQAGIATNIAAAGGVVWLGGGLPGFGLLLFLLFLGFVFFAIGGARRRAMGPGRPWGRPGHWGGDDARHEWVREMHRRLHDEERGGDRPPASTPTA